MARSEPVYLPDEADINYRAVATRFFKVRGWDIRVVDQIMNHDNPSIDTVERLVRVYGDDYAYQLIQKVNSDQCRGVQPDQEESGRPAEFSGSGGGCPEPDAGGPEGEAWMQHD